MICYSTYTLYKTHIQNNGGEKGPLLITSRWVVAEDCAKIQKIKEEEIEWRGYGVWEMEERTHVIKNK